MSLGRAIHLFFHGSRKRLFVLAVFVLSIGVAVGAIAFTVADQALLEPISGVDSSHELLTVEFQSSDQWAQISYRAFETLRNHLEPVAHVTARSSNKVDFRTDPDGRVLRLSCELIPENYFDVLGVVPVMGSLPPLDETLSDRDVVWISHSLWQSRFLGTADIVGRIVSINGVEVTVAGVLNPRFSGTYFAETAELWMPIRQIHVALPYLPPDFLMGREGGYYHIIVRPRFDLAPEILQRMVERMVVELNVIWNPETTRIVVSRGIGRPSWIVKGIRNHLYGMALLGIFFFFISAFSSSILLLCGGFAHLREWAVMKALGATQVVVFRRICEEGFLCVAVALVPGLLMAHWFLKFSAVDLSGYLEISTLSLSSRFVGFIAVFGISLAIFSTAAPAFMALRTSGVEALKEGGGVAGRFFWPHKSLVVLQLAGAMAMCSIALSFSQTVENFDRLEPGFQPDRVFSTELSPITYRLNRDETRSLYRQILARLSHRRGVESVSLADSSPFSGRIVWRTVTAEGANVTQRIPVQQFGVSGGYFETLGIPLIHGRTFDPSEVYREENTLDVCIVSEGLAQELWKGVDATGRFLNIGENHSCQIIGVAGEHYTTSLVERTHQIFFPMGQSGLPGSAAVLIRSGLESREILSLLEQEMESVDPRLPVYPVQAVRNQLASQYSTAREVARYSRTVASMVILLTALSIYGLISALTRARWQELGIRKAVGATPLQMARLLVADIFWLTALAAVLGFLLLLSVSSRIIPYLYQVELFSWWILGISVVTVGLFVSASAIVAARKGIRGDPAALLKAQ